MIFGVFCLVSSPVTHLWYLDNMSNIVYLKNFLFFVGGGGGFSRLVFFAKLGIPPQKQTEIIKSDELVDEIIFFSLMFSFWLYVLIFV